MNFHFLSHHDVMDHHCSFNYDFRTVASRQQRMPNEVQPSSGDWFEILSLELIWDTLCVGGPPGSRDTYVL
ncbi:uncharacterized protein DS421_20g692530 [Arachis hypogaea]|nr:uncharacterized protein DS421_20g692530 [Arachis hypogaea]